MQVNRAVDTAAGIPAAVWHLRVVCDHADDVAGIPIIVTENGFSGTDDSRRVEYYQRAIRSVASTIKDGIDVRGYFAWPAFDNFEWNSGYRLQFGVIAVDRATQQRTAKPSAYWLGNVARENRISLE